MLEVAASTNWIGRLRVSRRDREILDLARRLYDGRDFGQTLRALYEATTTIIPAGRIYVLGSREGAPIYGSLISGIGIVETGVGIRVVRVPR